MDRPAGAPLQWCRGTSRRARMLLDRYGSARCPQPSTIEKEMHRRRANAKPGEGARGVVPVRGADNFVRQRSYYLLPQVAVLPLRFPSALLLLIVQPTTFLTRDT